MKHYDLAECIQALYWLQRRAELLDLALELSDEMKDKRGKQLNLLLADHKADLENLTNILECHLPDLGYLCEESAKENGGQHCEAA